MEKHFTHLHLHTEYSLLDGAIRINQLVDYGKQHNLKALAITDHGNIFGAVNFFQKAKKAGIKPIIGMEAYFTEDAAIKSASNKYYHLILLVQNAQGYKNLCKLISYSFKEGFYFKPRIDYKMLAQYNEGLIVTSACLGGHIPKLIQENNTQELDTRIDWFLKTFGPERFYLEVQPEDQQAQTVLNHRLYDLAQKKGLQLLAAGDCHYPSLADHQAHEVMLSIQTQGKLSDPDRYSFGDCRTYMRSPQEMLELFKDHPEAVWNSGEIADRCNFEFETGKLHFPQYAVPQEHTQETYFKKLCQEGLDALLAQGYIEQTAAQDYQARLDLEVELIIKMGYVGYFLVVGDFIQWAKKQAIPVGPGRGSAAGSLVAWALQITNIDPIKYGLLFERFLNPERVSMPDIDIDFCIEGRERVIEYVKDTYGHDNVCQIITFGTMMAKGVLKDVARVLSIPFEDANALTALIPTQLNITLQEAREQEAKLNDLITSNPQVAQLFEIAQRLEGLTRHASKHAAGIVISPEAIDEVLPVFIPAKTTDLVTQYAMTELETLGFLKMDFLGLKTLTVIDKTVKTIKELHGTALVIDKLPLDDKKTFELLCTGKTSGVFQLESGGLKEVLKKLQPSTFEDIIAVNALYRPGPLGSGMVDDFIERKHGRQKVTYLLPELEPILKETYGVIIYQEQVMKIASAVAGYSLGEADILRRAMGKKKAEVMTEQSAIFVKRSQERGIDPKKAQELFDLMAYFAGYGFNKSHSAAYAMIAYQTAYIKANYPAEFMAALITLEATHAEKMSFYLEEAKAMGLTILRPSINHSLIDFSVKGGALLFGLQGIKNVGLSALTKILEERSKQPFKDILDVAFRVDLRTVNKRVMEHLIWAGAFDELPGNRAQKTAELDLILETALEKKKAALTGQMGLFASNSSKKTDERYVFQPIADWSDREKLEKEKEVVGFYISAHPLDIYKKQLSQLMCTSFQDIFQKAEQLPTQAHPVTSYGILKSKRVITTKKGDKMAFIQIEDYTQTVELVVFPVLFKKIEQWLNSYELFIIKGTLEAGAGSKKIIADQCVPLELLYQEWKSIQYALITVPEGKITDIAQTLKTLPKGKISIYLQFKEKDKQFLLKTAQTIALDKPVLDSLESNQFSLRCAL